jgi:hypothetical protein
MKQTNKTMENVYQRMIELFESNGSIKTPVKLVFKEPIVLSPFIGKTKSDKEYDEKGRLIRYKISKKRKKEYNLYLYKSTYGEICFSNKASRVKKIYPHYVLFKESQLESIELISDKSKEIIDFDLYNRNYLLNNIHDNLWNDIKENLISLDYKSESLIRENSGRKIKTASMKSIFPKWVCDGIKDAIENKTNFSYSLSGNRRTRSVEVTLCKDGKLRAWYSSEYAGCGHGAYYLLINPYTAVFCEFD